MNIYDNTNIDLDTEIDIVDEFLDDERTTTKPLLYVSAPKHTFESSKFNQYLSKIFADYSAYDIKISKYEFRDTDMWMDLWLHLCLAVDKLIFMSDEHGYIGFGTWEEIRTVHARTNITYLSPDMEYISIDDILIYVVNNGACLRHYANVLVKHNIISN